MDIKMGEVAREMYRQLENDFETVDITCNIDEERIQFVFFDVVALEEDTFKKNITRRAAYNNDIQTNVKAVEKAYRDHVREKINSLYGTVNN